MGNTCCFLTGALSEIGEEYNARNHIQSVLPQALQMGEYLRNKGRYFRSN